MIYFNLNLHIRHPFAPKWRSLWFKSGSTPIKNKFWELQLMRTAEIFKLKVSFTSRQDHAGPEFEIGLLGLNFHAMIYDNRHWDHDNNRWMEHN